MVRISAIFIAACMVLIAGSIGVVVYLRFGFTGAESALVALGALTALAVYNAIAARKHDRLEASNQLANLARGSGDLARQLAEFGRRLERHGGQSRHRDRPRLGDRAAARRRDRGTVDAGQATRRTRWRPTMRRCNAERRSLPAVAPPPAGERRGRPHAAPESADCRDPRAVAAPIGRGAGRAARAQDRSLRRARPRRHHCRDRQSHRLRARSIFTCSPS